MPKIETLKMIEDRLCNIFLKKNSNCTCLLVINNSNDYDHPDIVYFNR